MNVGRLFYQIKPVIPRRIQITLRRQIVMRKKSYYKNIWPIDRNAGLSPKDWLGWPDKKKFALVLTHDVDTEEGQKKCKNIMRIEEEMGFKSSFNFVPERYQVSPSLRSQLSNKGFEIGVHGLNHDGKLYKSRKIFQERSCKINHYLCEWKSVGFRSPAMHHQLNWIHDLDIEYDSSTFDTDPFEPQSDAVGTIFPFVVYKDEDMNGYVEIPYTLPQDFTLFVLMKENSITIWKKKLDWIVSHGGMALVNVHPDYMNFDGTKVGVEQYSAEYYVEFLEYIRSKYEGKYWHVLPKDMARFWVREVQGERVLAGQD